MPHATTHHVLFIDAYDSFTNNIIALLETKLRVQVTTIKIDDSISNFAEFLTPFSAVIAGPGPGDPRNSKDVGLIRELWKLEEHDLLPVLGICLGFQSLVLAFGGTIDRLVEPRHGLVRRVRGTGEGIFRGMEVLETVQYHSLYASLGPGGKHKGSGSYDAEHQPLKSSVLRPLAWDYELDNFGDCSKNNLSDDTSRVLMAVEHKSKPFFGIQFHPESICSNSNSQMVIEVWWDIAKRWSRPCRDTEYSLHTPIPSYADLGVVQIDWRDETKLPKHRRAVGDSRNPSISINEVPTRIKRRENSLDDLKGYDGVNRSQNHRRKCTVRVIESVINTGEATVPSICESLGLTDREVAILDSEMHQRQDVGEHSIIGIVSRNSLRLVYQVGTNVVREVHNGQSEIIDLRRHGGSIFAYLKYFMSQYKVEKSNTGVPFWGGLIGFISYEAGLETIGITHSRCSTDKGSQRPDSSFVFVERSIVIDHSNQQIHVQTIKPDDQDWVDKTTLRLKRTREKLTLSMSPDMVPLNAQVSLPDATSYRSKIRACQSAIRAGNSYELCLTTQASIHTPNRLATWPLYLRLRHLNPAPFSAYLRLGNLALLSSSPERFLRWSRPSKPPVSSTCLKHAFNHEEKTITCQFRPIKGTVKRQPDPNHPPLTLAEATALLETPKERAENLMIVDLIRHDLHGVVGSGRVHVPKLMVVEEYATLFQLVSVIEGSLLVSDSENEDTSNEIDNRPVSDDPIFSSTQTLPKTGIDILAASLPPGSMTGAPKLRSCHILRSLESSPRGVYSGVAGYLDVGGGGDFSVVIRSAVRWDDDDDDGIREGNRKRSGADDGREDGPEKEKEAAVSDNDNEEEWTIGAGGAVTSLSSEEGEWEEMIAKMRSTMRLFEDGS